MIIPLLHFLAVSRSDRVSKVPEHVYLTYSVLIVGKLSTVAVLVEAVAER